MRKFMKVSLAGAAGAFALVALGTEATKAADMTYPQGQYEAPPAEPYAPPPQAYGPPPAEESYGYPPPVAYAYPPPVPYYASPYVVVPGPYFVRGPYWRGYAPRYAYGYGHWGHGYRHW
jgi:hypothetical protein